MGSSDPMEGERRRGKRHSLIVFPVFSTLYCVISMIQHYKCDFVKKNVTSVNISTSSCENV